MKSAKWGETLHKIRNESTPNEADEYLDRKAIPS